MFGFLSRGLAVSSRCTYTSGMKKFRLFCSLFLDLFPALPIPASEYQLMMFVLWLLQSLSPTSIEVYFEAVHSFHADWGFSDSMQNKPRLCLVLQGISRTRCALAPQPITRDVLCIIYGVRRACINT